MLLSIHLIILLISQGWFLHICVPLCTSISTQPCILQVIAYILKTKIIVIALKYGFNFFKEAIRGF